MPSADEKPKVRLLAVVQSRQPGTQHWQDEGRVGDVTPENFDEVAQKYLNLFRKNHPELPHDLSRVIRRTTTTVDQSMGD